MYFISSDDGIYIIFMGGRIKMGKESLLRGFYLFGLSCVVLLLSSCASSRRMTKEGPFTRGSRTNVHIPGEKKSRINLWPLFYRKDAYFSVLWPLFDKDPDGMALRPFYVKDNQDYSVCFPFSGWTIDKYGSDGWIMNYYWDINKFKTLWMFAPFVFSKKSLSGDSKLQERILWIMPFFHGFRPDETVYAVLPFWYRQIKDKESTNWLFPYFSKRTPDNFESMLLPLWLYLSKDAKPGYSEKQLVVFPLLTKYSSKRDSSNESAEQKITCPLFTKKSMRYLTDAKKVKSESSLSVPVIPLLWNSKFEHVKNGGAIKDIKYHIWSLLFYQSLNKDSFTSNVFPLYFYRQDQVKMRKAYKKILSTPIKPTYSLIIPPLLSGSSDSMRFTSERVYHQYKTLNSKSRYKSGYIRKQTKAFLVYKSSNSKKVLYDELAEKSETSTSSDRGVPAWPPLLYYQSENSDGGKSLWIIPYHQASSKNSFSSMLFPLYFYSSVTPEIRKGYERFFDKPVEPMKKLIFHPLLSGYTESLRYIPYWLPHRSSPVNIGIEKEQNLGALLYSKSSATKTMYSRVTSKTTVQNKWNRKIPAYIPLLYYQGKDYDAGRALWIAPYYRYRSDKTKTDHIFPFWYQSRTTNKIAKEYEPLFKGIKSQNSYNYGIPFLCSFYNRKLNNPYKFTTKGKTTRRLTIKYNWITPLYRQNHTITRKLKNEDKKFTEKQSWSRGAPIIPFLYSQSHTSNNKNHLWLLPYYGRWGKGCTISSLIPLYYYQNNHNNKQRLDMYPLLYFQAQNNHKFSSMQLPLWYYSSDKNRHTMWSLLWHSSKEPDKSTQALFPLFYSWENKSDIRLLSLPGFYLNKNKNSQEFYSSLFWPMMKYEKDRAGNSYWRFWPLASHERKMGIPSMFDYASDMNYSSSSWRILWFFMNCEKDAFGKVKHFSILNRLYRYNRQHDIVNIDIFPGISRDTAPGKSSFSILGGLYSYQNINGKHSGKILYIPWGN
jgi:hypothetical protein